MVEQLPCKQKVTGSSPVGSSKNPRGHMIHGSAKIGKRTKIQNTAIIQEGCEIGDNCFIGHYVVMRPNTKIGNNTVIGHHTVFEGDCVVGEDVLIHSQCHITKGVIIEDKVFIAPMFVGANDPVMVHNRRHIKPFECTPYIIRYGARIGVGVKVLPGVEIGRNAVVGVGSVVTKNVPDGVVVMGCPAVPVKLVPE